MKININRLFLPFRGHRNGKVVQNGIAENDSLQVSVQNCIHPYCNLFVLKF